MRAVVVGGTGFLGRHVIAALSRARPDCEVIPAARHAPPVPLEAALVPGDRTDPNFVRELLGRSPDLWFDLVLMQPQEMDDLVAAWADGTRCAAFVVAGSIAEYGLRSGLPCPLPEDAPLLGNDDYARGKVQAWQVAAAASDKAGFPVIWAVLPQLWGPGDTHGRDSVFVRDLRAGRAALLRGNGRTLLPDGCVETAAAALVHLALARKGLGTRFNVAGPRPLTPLRFVQEAARTLDRPALVRHLRQADVAAWERLSGGRFRPVFGDYDLLLDTRRLLTSGFAPPIGAIDGIHRTARWHEQHPAPVDERYDGYAQLPPALIAACPEVVHAD
jgi:nucleoside-diphosphate-sugar epimerase